MANRAFLDRLERVQPNGKGWSALCPAHDDHNPSLSISTAADGRLLIFCHAGCCTEAIVAAVGMEMSDLFFSESTGARPSNHPLPTAKFREDLSDDLVRKLHAQLGSTSARDVLRDRGLTDEVVDRYQLGFKDGRVTIPILDSQGQCRNIRLWCPPAERGKSDNPQIRSWATGLGTNRLYPIDQLRHKTLVLCEGELDALALIGQGIPAVTTTGGANAWTTELSRELKEAGVEEVVLALDNDKAGDEGTARRATSLSALGMRIRRLAWPNGRADGWDVTDELIAHGDESVRRLVAAAAEYETPAPARFTALSLSELISSTGAVDWTVEGLLPTRGVLLLAGEPGTGKTWLLLDLATAIATGSLWLGRFKVRRGNVLIIDAENDTPQIKERVKGLLRAKALEPDDESCPVKWSMNSQLKVDRSSDVDALKEYIRTENVDLIIFDSFIRFHDSDENDAKAMARVSAALREIITDTGVTIVLGHHHGKGYGRANDLGSRARGSSEIRASVDSQIDTKKISSKTGREFVLEHIKSRYNQPEPSFKVFLEGAIESGIYLTTGAIETRGEHNTESIQEWVRKEIRGPGVISRQALLRKGMEDGLLRDAIVLEL